MSSRTLFEFEGKGKITFDSGIEFITEFNITTRADSRAKLSCKSKFFVNLTPIFLEHAKGVLPPIHAKLEGQENSTNAKVTINDLYLDTLKISGKIGQAIELDFEFLITSSIDVEYHPLKKEDEILVDYSLTNFIFLGCEYSIIENRKIRDKFQVKLNDFDLLFKQDQNYDTIAKKLKENKGIEVCSHATILTTFGRIEELDELLNDSLTLLSFASGTYIANVYKQIFKDNVLCQTIFMPCITQPYHHADPAIDIKNLGKCYTKIFLETVFPQYQSLKNELGLNIVINYYLYSKLVNIYQAKYLLGAIAFECLTSYLSGYFKARNKKVDLSNFRERIKSCFNEFQIQYVESELRFIGIRDRLVHTGNFPPNTNVGNEYGSLINLLDRTILTILGYKGHVYLNRSNDYSREILQ